MNTKIKKSILLIIGVAVAGSITFTSCTYKEEREKLKSEATALEEELQARDSAYNEIMELMVGVEKQIDQIKEKENLVSVNSQGDVTKSDKSQMVADMQAIDQLIQKSNQRIDMLTEKLNNAGLNVKSFKNRIAELSNNLEEREASVASLKDELEKKNVQIAELNTEVNSLSAAVDSRDSTIETQLDKLKRQTYELNKAFVVVAPEKQLQESGIVTKEGGFLWMGKTTELSEDATKDNFVEIDIAETDHFVIDAEKVKMVTEHPSDSYEFVKEGEKVQYLRIKDPKRFWEISKYLVVSTKS
jgi:peptidoglycan hydrolase CwlO-like protein